MIQSKKSILYIFLFSLGYYLYASEVYTWVDNHGITHYSNTYNHNKNAKKISTEPQSVIQSSKKSNSLLQATTPVEKTNNLLNFNIIKPINNSTIQNSRNQSIPVKLSGFEPIFEQNGYITLNVDNKLNHTFSAGSNKFYINVTVRGQHSLQAIAYSPNHKLLAKTQKIIFYIQNQIAKTKAGTSQTNSNEYNNQTTKNYENFLKTHNNELINPKSYNNGFIPTAKNYQQQINGSDQ